MPWACHSSHEARVAVAGQRPARPQRGDPAAVPGQRGGRRGAARGSPPHVGFAPTLRPAADELKPQQRSRDAPAGRRASTDPARARVRLSAPRRLVSGPSTRGAARPATHAQQTLLRSVPGLNCSRPGFKQHCRPLRTPQEQAGRPEAGGGGAVRGRPQLRWASRETGHPGTAPARPGAPTHTSATGAAPRLPGTGCSRQASPLPRRGPAEPGHGPPPDQRLSQLSIKAPAPEHGPSTASTRVTKPPWTTGRPARGHAGEGHGPQSSRAD